VALGDSADAVRLLKVGLGKRNFVETTAEDLPTPSAASTPAQRAVPAARATR
jgi:hypothetical protein